MNESAQKAFEAGRLAKSQGKGLEAMPSAYRATKSLAKAFEKGLRSPEIMHTQEPVVIVQQVQVTTQTVLSTQGGFIVGPGASVTLAPDAPLPEYFERPKAIPCRRCRSVRLEDGKQAVIQLRGHGDIGVFFCKARGCGYQFKLPIR